MVGKLDEAHLLRYEQLETIRMLTNHNLDADSPLAALLVGQPTLRRTMKLAVLAALEQRVALRYTMPPMTSQETTSYITHHLKLAPAAPAPCSATTPPPSSTPPPAATTIVFDDDLDNSSTPTAGTVSGAS